MLSQEDLTASGSLAAAYRFDQTSHVRCRSHRRGRNRHQSPLMQTATDYIRIQPLPLPERLGHVLRIQEYAASTVRGLRCIGPLRGCL